jgi:thioredoxin reductase/NAD-dependent dihydropyrimidine dehydrogenase PreA subunit
MPSDKPPLFSAGLSDPRSRAALPSPKARGRGVARAEPTSDVTRFRGVPVAAAAGAAVSLVTALLVSPPGAGGAPGPLSRPHLTAGLTCSACHTDSEWSAEVARAACTTCHGAHASQRRGHAAALASGAMTCASCHPIHRSDQGVIFTPESPALRFAPGAEAELAAVAFRPARRATVAIPTAGSCKRCHALTSPTDPIARCLLGGQEALGDARPVVCFDEHASALPADEGRSRDRSSAVCAGNHTQDRAVTWDAAREAAALMPVVRASARPWAPWVGLYAGLAAAALAFAGVRGSDALRRRRRSRAAPVTVPEAAPRVRLPQIDTGTCLGCYACVDACPYDVLEVERYVAVVVRPDACCGLTLCEQRCPNDSLRITDGEPIGDRPRLGADLDSLDVPGLYLAGDVTGLPLIKNAILQGARAAERIAASLGPSLGASRTGDALDLVIVGAGPAGISAALRAGELGLSFEVIEQGSVAQSIKSFPRGKLVFDQPLELPVTGKLWLRESTKEELLSHWLRIVRQNRLPIREDTRVTALARDGARGLFQVTSAPREGGASEVRLARRVLLAIGQRGSPRRLDVPLAPDVEARVHYHLSDARSFEGKRVIVAGLGDVAMEAAVALSRQPSTAVTVVHRGEGFSRGKSRNIAELKRLVEAGRVGLRLATAITAITAERVTLRGPAGEASLGWDAVLVMIGSIPPWGVLRAAGVRTIAEGGEAGERGEGAMPGLGHA